MSGTLGDDTLVFIHLPKTGGTALRTSLLRAFDPPVTALVYAASDLDGAMTRQEFNQLPAEVRSGLRLVMGHFSYGIHRQVERPCRYATLLRDPVERVVSLYYHFLNLPGVRFGSKGYRERLRLRLRRTSLEDWIFGESRLPADNLAVRNLTGRRDIPFGGCTDTLFDEAMANIDRDFAALLATERMPENALAMGRVVGRELPLVGSENTNPKRPATQAIDASVLQRIRELNRFDERLHQIALARLGS